jgi:hypothetical protein
MTTSPKTPDSAKHAPDVQPVFGAEGAEANVEDAIRRAHDALVVYRAAACELERKPNATPQDLANTQQTRDNYLRRLAKLVCALDLCNCHHDRDACPHYGPNRKH